MQNLSEDLLEANEVKNKQQLTYITQLMSATTEFTDAMTVLNMKKNNQVASLQQKIECLYRETAVLTLEISL
ncbi:hypothetical protein EMPG_09545 [Blastomyces silverae]|uniref:Uncharacterized protein n=1 Tax=Blastomyces silverae TaxID=2060906 RepID=A0A0H1BMU1_9EURO|nr:hypothetical protein EMPG_09545 [Blastomyces silverae]